MPKPLDHIVIHQSESAYGCASLIRGWHQSKGWKDIGYHFVICNGFIWNAKEYIVSLDGSIEVGRYLDGDNFIEANEVGAHALGYNETSIGIVLIGHHPNLKGQKLTFPRVGLDYDIPRGYSSPMFKSLTTLVTDLALRHSIPVQYVVGHNETPGGKKQGKTCPGFDMEEFRQKCLKPFFTAKV